MPQMSPLNWLNLYFLFLLLFSLLMFILYQYFNLWLLSMKTYKFYTKKYTFLYKKVLNTNEFSLESLDLLNNNYSNNYKSSKMDFITNTKLLSSNIYISNSNNIVYTSNYYNDLLNVLDMNILLDNNSNSNYMKYNKINKLIKNNFCSLNKW